MAGCLLPIRSLIADISRLRVVPAGRTKMGFAAVAGMSVSGRAGVDAASCPLSQTLAGGKRKVAAFSISDEGLHPNITSKNISLYLL